MTLPMFRLVIFAVILLVCAFQCQGIEEIKPRCCKNEVAVDCAEPCQPSCSWPDRPKCPTFTCSKGCECAEGFLRETNETSSRCVKCSKKSKLCGRNEVKSSCANPCQPTCSWKTRPPCPTLTCSEGCVCRDNFYRETSNTNSSCVKC